MGQGRHMWRVALSVLWGGWTEWPWNPSWWVWTKLDGLMNVIIVLSSFLNTRYDFLNPSQRWSVPVLFLYMPSSISLGCSSLSAQLNGSLLFSILHPLCPWSNQGPFHSTAWFLLLFFILHAHYFSCIFNALSLPLLCVHPRPHLSTVA